MRGTVSMIRSRVGRRRIVNAYCERFQLGTLFQDQIARTSLYCFRPEWIRYLDNSVSFGYKLEINVEQPAQEPMRSRPHRS